MKRNIVSLILFCIFFSGCIELDFLTQKLCIEGKVIWSADLLEFVTPILSYKDASGLREVVITDDMITDEQSSKLCHFSIEYAYTLGEESPTLSVRYEMKENVDIYLNSKYEFFHNLSISSVVVDDQNQNKLFLFTNTDIGGNEGIIGTDVDEYIHSLTNTPDKQILEISCNKEEITDINVKNVVDIPISFNKKVYTVNGVSFTMIIVEGGTFTMGSLENDGDAQNDEKPNHEVTLSDYAIGETEVTQELWQAVMGNNPSCDTGNLQCPINNVSWDDCQLFISRLNELTGKKFRLPTESEWEYASRGGSSNKSYMYSGSNSISDVAWYWHNSDDMTHPVKTKQPNELGIYDMSGNVWEWCSDWYGDYPSSHLTNPQGPSVGFDHIIRGGSWDCIAKRCRVSLRHFADVGCANGEIGIRLALGVSEFSNSEESEKSYYDTAICAKIFEVNGVEFNMIYVKGATFTMGSPNSDSEAADDEKPTHKVTLNDFAIGETEVTQELWQAVMGNNPSYYMGDMQQPVDYVSWDDCQFFIKKLNELTGKNFRLPTEAEWEFAARGGCVSRRYKYSGSNILDDVAWYFFNSDTPCPVKTKQANELGVYDMSGNVSEWCADWFESYSSAHLTNPTGPSTGCYRILRGGSYICDSEYCRVAFRDMDEPDYEGDGNGYGLRLVLSVPDASISKPEVPFIPDETIEARMFNVNGVGFKMVYVKGSRFTMGSTDDDTDAEDNEKPAHKVTLSDYTIGETEVTQELWLAVMGSNPSDYPGDLQRPVECVSWDDCRTFITRLNELTGCYFRLPTEAEWEYAARGGAKSKGYKYSGSNTIDNVAWYDSNSLSGTYAVKTKQPNELGIYDMSGNVWEWCSDRYDSYSSSAQTNPTGPSFGSKRVLRGGGWNSYERNCRVTHRNGYHPFLSDNNIGLRLAR